MDSNSTHPPNFIPVSSKVPPLFEYSAAGVDGDRKPLNLWPGACHSPVATALWKTRSKIFDRLLYLPLDAPPQSRLLTKTPSQSRTIVLYNFSSDFVLREQYGDPWNEVRVGKLLEDLDALAGTVSVKVS
ncbi:Acyl-coenzyme A thioesterase 2, chloroplastic [Ancistrocladus abbreviatus]